MTKDHHVAKPGMSVFELPVPNISTRDALALICGGSLGIIASSIAIYLR